MEAKDKAITLAEKFCSPTDVFKPNISSIRNAIKCCEEIIKVVPYYDYDARTTIEQQRCTIEYFAKFWDDVIYELTILNEETITN